MGAASTILVGREIYATKGMTSMTAAPDGWLRTLGSTGMQISAVTAGGSGLGSIPAAFGYEVAEADAVEFVAALLESPIRSVDTSNGYSDGDSERRIGAGIARHGSLPSDFLVTTKVDPIGSDYSGERVRASVRESRERLGVDTLPLVHLHDPEGFPWQEITAPGGAVDTLVRLKEEGEIGHIGLAGGPLGLMDRYLDLGVFEVLLIHNRWTLVDRSAGPILQRAQADGLGVVNAAVYGGGILAAPRSGSTKYAYREAAPETLVAIEQMTVLAEEYGTDLPTAALQFSLRDARVHSTIVGMTKVSRLDGLVTASRTELPDEFWERIEALTPPEQFWIGTE